MVYVFFVSPVGYGFDSEFYFDTWGAAYEKWAEVAQTPGTISEIIVIEE